MKFTYMKVPLNKYTFKNKQIREWVEKHCEGKVLNLFAGKIKLDVQEIRNDIRENMPSDYHMDALEFVETWKGGLFNTVVLDPPYAYRKSMEMYEGAVSSPFNQLKEKIPTILTPNGIVITFGYHCLDEETQCLTNTGWKHYYEIDQQKDKIATFDRYNENIEYESINNLFVYDYDGVLKSICDRHIDQLITNNHKIVLKYKHSNYPKIWKDEKWRIIECNTVTPHSSVYIPVSGLYNGSISIGADFAELLGWIISEGHETDYKSIFIYQSNKNKENVRIIRRLLEKCKIVFTEKSYSGKPDLVNFYIPKRKNKNFYKVVDKMLENIKTPKWNLLHIKHNELKALFDGLVKGDGSRYTDKSCVFYQKSDYTRKWFQTLCLHLGYRTVNNHKHQRVNVSFTNEKCIPPGKRFKNTFTDRKYKGKIWCVNVKNNCFVIKRNDKISITGNSNVMGESRGFFQEHICLMSHGGAIHDTIAVIERRRSIETFF